MTVVPRVWLLRRSGSVPQNTSSVKQRAATFASAAPDGSVLLTRRGEDGLRHYLIAPHQQGLDQAVQHLAHTVGARHEEIDGAAHLLAARKVAVAKFDTDSILGRDSPIGAELGETSGRLASSLRQGEWVAAVLRQPTNQERKRWLRWLQHQVGAASTPTHHSVQQSAVVMSVWAGADNGEDAKSLLRQVVAAMPGFDLNVIPETVSATKVASLIAGSGAAAIIAAATAGATGTLAALPDIAGAVGFLGGLGVPAVVAGALYAFGRIPSFPEKVRRHREQNLLPPTPQRWLVRRPRKERIDKNGAVIAAQDGDYPLDPTGFIVAPQLPAGIVAPHGADSGASSTATRVAPQPLRERIGPMIGVNDDQPVYLSAADFYAGIIAFGQAGSGKSRLIQGLYAWHGADRVTPAGLPGFPGRRNALIAFESKGEGANDYMTWAATVGDKALRIDFAGTSPLGLNILDIPGDSEKKARAIVNAMRYAFSEGSIQERSFDTLTQTFTAAFSITPEVAAAAELPAGASPFYYANILLGGRGDELGVALAGAIRSEAARLNLDATTDLGNAAEKLTALYAGKTPAQRAQLTDAPRNKVSALLAAESWWARPQQISWDQILEHHLNVVINVGIAPDGEQADDALVEQVSAMMMYTLYEAIKRRSSGWYEAGRAVSIFADELKLLAGSSATVLTWLRDQGRSYGVRAIFATQYPEQLIPEVRNSVMGFGTLLAFSQNNPQVVASLIADLALSGDVWEPQDVANLPPYETIARTTVSRMRQSPFTAKILDFWSDRERFTTIQGYTDEETP